MSFSKLAIIGTAGRGDEKDLLTADHYHRMVEASKRLIEHHEMDKDKLILVSGGAAWADHIVVDLALCGLIPFENVLLYLPAELTEGGYEGEGEFGIKTANTANYYHKLFSRKIGRSTISELVSIASKGSALIPIKNGFKARNSRVATELSDNGAVLAFTFGDPNSPQMPWTISSFPNNIHSDTAGLKDGGTADTWNKSKCRKFHCRIGPIDNDYLLKGKII